MKATSFPELSPAFTIQDIRKMRDWNGERYIGMTRQEIADEINSGALEFEALIESARLAEEAGTARRSPPRHP